MSFWSRFVLLCQVATVGISGLSGTQAPDPQTQQHVAEEQVVIAVGGDVLPESSWKGPQDAFHFLDGMRAELASADLVFVNLEEPITSCRRATPFKSQSEVAAGRDYILAGLRDTLHAFHLSDLPVVGAGFKLDAEKPFIFEKHGCRVALLAFSDIVPRNSGATDIHLGIASAKDMRDLVNAIRRARRGADFVVLMMHWGGQGSHLIIPRQRQLARAAVGAGCDVIVGMHPHVLQGIEYFGHVPVLYSIGNFAFASKRPASQESVLVKLTIDSKRLAKVDLVPVVISPSGVPAPAGQEQGKEILDHLDGFCRMFNSQVQGERVVPSSPRERLVYGPQVSTGVPPDGRRPRRRPASRGGAETKS